jgi:hypothetical protein
MESNEVLSQLALGALLGLIGQGIRVAIGLKKQSDEAAASGQKLADNFDFTRLGVSLAMGAIAGSLCGIVLMGTVIDKEYLLTIITSGYAGTDFVEGILLSQTAKNPKQDGIG